MPNKYISFLCGRFFDGISSGMFMLALPWIMLEQTNNGTLVALSALASTLLSFCLSPFLSTLIDIHSRKLILLSVQLIQALTAIIVLFAFFYDWQPIVILIFSQIVFWCSNDLAWKTNNAFIQENFEQVEYPKITSYQEIIMQITTLGAGAVGIILLEHWSMFEFAMIAALSSLVAALSFSVMPYQRKVRLKHDTRFFKQLVATKAIISKQSQLLGFLALSCLSYPVLTFLVKLVPIYFYQQGFGAHWFASWKLSFGIGALISGLLIRYLFAKYETEKLMISSIALIACLLFSQSLFSSPWIIVSFTFGLGFFNSVNRISRMNKMNKEIKLEERGRIEGSLHMFSAFFQSLGYGLIAILSHYDATQLGFGIISLFMLFAALLMLNIYQTSHQLIKVN